VTGFAVGEPNAPFQEASSDDDAVRFIKRVLPPAARGRSIGLHWFDNRPGSWEKAKEQGRPRPHMSGRAYTTAEEAVGWARFLLRGAVSRNEPPPDLYVCMSLCGMEVRTTSKAGREYFKPTRRVEAMRASKTLYADFDVKPGAYPDKAAVLAHIDAMVAAGKIPEPTVRVDSGNGIHAHWVLDRELTRHEWESLAKPLAVYLSKTLGMHIDTNITVDSVRVLRLPATVNAKDVNRVIPTALIGNLDPNDIPVATFEALLGVSVAQGAAAGQVLHFPSRPQAVTQATLPQAFENVTPFAPLPPGPVFGAGIDPDMHGAPPLDFAEVVAECPTLSDIRARRGAGDPGVLWMLAILAASFAPEQERAQWAHEFSSGYAGYTPAETDAKLDEKVRARLSSGGRIGWPTCAAFAPHSAKCQGCPMLGQGKSPLHAGKTAPALPVSDLPEPYMRDTSAGVTRIMVPRADEAPACVLPYDVQDAQIEERPDGVFFSAQIIHPRNAPTRLRVPLHAATAWRDEATRALGQAQITLLPEQVPEARRFIVSWIQSLQAKQSNAHVRDPYGWVKMRDGTQGFAYNGRVVGANGKSETGAAADDTFRDRFHSTGSAAEWKVAADLMMGMGRIDIQAAIATAFAAPLMRFTGHNGAIVSVYSPFSGVQKSSALMVAQSVWGDPKTGMSRLDDTANAVGKKLGALRHLPVYWDELQTRDQGAQFAKMAFQLTQGTEKARMMADTRLRAAGEWATLLVCGSNNSIREIMLAESTEGSGAGVARVFEFEVRRVPLTLSPSAAQMLLAKTQENFGVVGALYAQHLVDNLGGLQAGLAKVAASFEKGLNAYPGEQRFWIAAASTIFLGATLANQLQGGALIQFDLKALHTFLLDTLRAQQSARMEDVTDHGTEEMAASIVQGFIDHCRSENACLETATVPQGAGRPQPVELRFFSDEARNRLKVPKAHIIHDDGRVRFDVEAFRHYVRNVRKLSFDAVRRDLEQFGNMTKARARWAGGTQWAGAVKVFYDIDTHHARTPLGARIGHGK